MSDKGATSQVEKAPRRRGRTPRAVVDARKREARLNERLVTRAAQETEARKAVVDELEAALAPTWNSLELHRSRWLSSLGEQPSAAGDDDPPATRAPLSTFSTRLLFGETPSVSEALDCAAGIAWWTDLRLGQHSKNVRTRREKEARALLDRRADLLAADSPCPSGVDLAVWEALLPWALEHARARGWLESPTTLPALIANFDPEGSPPELDLETLLDSSPDLRGLFDANPLGFDRASVTLLARFHEAELISDALAGRSAERFPARLDEDMLRRDGLIENGGRPTSLSRHLAAWILRTAGASIRATGLFLVHAELLDLDQYHPGRARRTQANFEQKWTDTRVFWKDRAARTPPVLPATLIGNLEVGAWIEHQGRGHTARLARGTPADG